MQTSTPLPTQPTLPRYPFFLLRLAVVFLLLVFVGRVILNQLAPVTVEPPPVPVENTADVYISRQRELIALNPDNPDPYANLGLALLAKVRLTNDPLLYAQAEQALNTALEKDEAHLQAIIGQGILALARHDFTGALEWVEQGETLTPFHGELMAVEVDALVELGRYPEAIAAAEELVNRKPGLPAYTRLSYLRELQGDTAGAIEMMALAADAGVMGTEEMLWTQVQLGHLYWNSGQLDQAELNYGLALELNPDYVYARAGMARVLMAQGNFSGAIAAYEQLVQQLPIPEFVIALGELYEHTGQTAQAEQQYELVRVVQQLNAEAGMNVDMELALFDAEHGDDKVAALARAEAAYNSRPSIYAADALAWALYHNGLYVEAQKYSGEALRLGTRDANLYYRAALIAEANGDEAMAQSYLETALSINPYFNVLSAPRARALLGELQ